MKGRYWFYERAEGDPDPRPLTLRSLMSTDVKTLTADQLVGDAIKLIIEHGIRHIPIVSRPEHSLIGLVTQTDLLRKVMHGRTMTNEEQYHAFLDTMLPLEDVMVRDVITLPPEAKVREAVSLFLLRKIRCVPVVDSRRAVLGIVTETDLMKLLEHMVKD
jgi:CBS-domain-containing membrane protein